MSLIFNPYQKIYEHIAMSKLPTTRVPYRAYCTPRNTGPQPFSHHTQPLLISHPF